MMQPVDAAPGCLMLSLWISRLLRPNVCVPGKGERRIAPGPVLALLNGWLTGPPTQRHRSDVGMTLKSGIVPTYPGAAVAGRHILAVIRQASSAL